jgi:hypothetical protein
MRPYDKSTDQASLELVHITRARAGDPPKVDSEIYKCISENQDWFDHSILEVLNNKNYCFYHIPEDTSTNQTNTFLINSVLYTLLWTYHSPTATTKGILIDRACSVVGNPEDTYEEFTTLLKNYKEYIHNPSLLVFLSSTHLISVIDRCLVKVRDTIRGIEGRSGHGGWHNQELDVRSTFEKYTLDTNWNNTMAYSKSAAECTTTLANLERQVELASDLNSFVVNNSYKLIAKHDIWDQSIKDSLKLATTFLQKRVVHAKPNVSYLQERARTQSAVVS